MKIEKVNDNQIRCTLTREDLASRELKINELAYGTEKAKNLFRDMMQQANFEFGFEAEDIPLMIEAIPLNSDCVVLIITKVEDPEELDTRFSRFAPSVMEEEQIDDEDLRLPDEFLDMFRKVQDEPKRPRKSAVASVPSEPSKDSAEDDMPPRLYRIDSLQQVFAVASVLGNVFDGCSSLYKDEKTDTYLLLIIGGADKANYDRACLCLSEFGSIQHNITTNFLYLDDHYENLIPGVALPTLYDIC